MPWQIHRVRELKSRQLRRVAATVLGAALFVPLAGLAGAARADAEPVRAGVAATPADPRSAWAGRRAPGRAGMDFSGRTGEFTRRAGSGVSGAARRSCAGLPEAQPVGMALAGLRRDYRAGADGWVRLTLRLVNRTGHGCGALRPVLACAARAAALRPDAVRLEWHERGRGRGRAGRGGWRRVALVARDGALAGRVGPADGYALPAHAGGVIALRLRIGAGAPTGPWLAEAVAFAPLPSSPATPWPTAATPAYTFTVHAPR